MYRPTRAMPSRRRLYLRRGGDGERWRDRRNHQRRAAAGQRDLPLRFEIRAIDLRSRVRAPAVRDPAVGGCTATASSCAGGGQCAISTGVDSGGDAPAAATASSWWTPGRQWRCEGDSACTINCRKGGCGRVCRVRGLPDHLRRLATCKWNATVRRRGVRRRFSLRRGLPERRTAALARCYPGRGVAITAPHAPQDPPSSPQRIPRTKCALKVPAFVDSSEHRRVTPSSPVPSSALPRPPRAAQAQPRPWAQRLADGPNSSAPFLPGARPPHARTAPRLAGGRIVPCSSARVALGKPARGLILSG